MQSVKCKLFGHPEKCCTDFTKVRGRKTRNRNTQANTVDKESNKANSIRLSRVVTGRHDQLVVLNNVVTNEPQQVKSIVYCNLRKRFYTANHTKPHLPLARLKHCTVSSWTGTGTAW